MKMKMHGIKIQHPFILLGTFLLLDLVTVHWLDVFDRAIFPEAAPLIVVMWLFGFISKEWRA